ncbi:MAG: acyclic terpene utilization AtuA family protein [Pseudonocardia sp.]
MAQRQPVLVGNGQGFWGDSVLGPVRLVNEGPLHYLTLDYLAEVTMSIMQKQRARNPKAGYATDFVTMVERVLPRCIDQGIKIVANAGGVNAAACAEAVAEVARKLGVSVKIGIVEGDDIMGQLDELMAGGEEFRNLDTDEPLKNHLDKLASANVYLGAQPIVDALTQGADIVITGRATDPSLVVGPLMYEFGWDINDHDKIAAATVAGHILECGTQSTGGNFDGWRDVPDMARIGYPVCEAYPDGTFVITKQEGTGGLVSTDTVTAQLLYELGDPHAYLTPDVTADFSTIELEQEGPNRVRVHGIKGHAPTSTYKVSMAYSDGYKVLGELTCTGPDAAEKARFTAELLFARLELDGTSYDDAQKTIEIVGTNTACFPGMVPPADSYEVIMRVGLREYDKRKANRFGGELASLLLSGPPGLTGFAAGRPRASEVIGYWPALLTKEKVSATVSITEVRA